MDERVKKPKQLETYDPVSNGGEEAIVASAPYTVRVTIQGSAPMLFHRWNNEAVEEKARAAKGSAAKKTDDVESYIYRNEQNQICLPGEYLRQSIIEACRYRQDPRSPRKSAMDLYRAGLAVLTELAPLGKSKDWDYIDKRRVRVQRQSITRHRPAFKAGWRATFDFLVMLPEYISRESLREVIEQAGRLVGIADFRPSFGRYGIVRFDVL
jgi:hypothetical protein